MGRKSEYSNEDFWLQATETVLTKEFIKETGKSTELFITRAEEIGSEPSFLQQLPGPRC